MGHWKFDSHTHLHSRGCREWIVDVRREQWVARIPSSDNDGRRNRISRSDGCPTKHKRVVTTKAVSCHAGPTPTHPLQPRCGSREFVPRGRNTPSRLWLCNAPPLTCVCCMDLGSSITHCVRPPLTWCPNTLHDLALIFETMWRQCRRSKRACVLHRARAATPMPNMCVMLTVQRTTADRQAEQIPEEPTARKA